MYLTSECKFLIFAVPPFVFFFNYYKTGVNLVVDLSCEAVWWGGGGQSYDVCELHQ
jgi:hypothetical protein